MKHTEFRNWFAWYPVAYGPYLAWCKTVQRRWDPVTKAWYYRRVPKGNVPRVYKVK